MHALNILATKILIVERDFIVKITSVGNEPIPINHLERDHRLILSYEAEAEEKTPEDIIKRILETIEVP